MKARWGHDRCSFFNFKFPPRHIPLWKRVVNKLYRSLGGRSCIPYRIDDWCDDSLLVDIRKLAARLAPKCVQIEYVYLSRLFECFDCGVFKILDTHDIITDRHKMFLKQGRPPEFFYTNRSQESIGINRANCILAIQPAEAAFFRQLTDKPVATVGHIVEMRKPSLPAMSAPTLMFIGSGNPINQDALSYLLEEVLPRVQVAVPDTTLEVYGGISSYLTQQIPGVVAMGNVNEPAEAYERAWVVVSPLRFGTGLKIKSIEALGFAKALVSAPAGYAGLEDGLGRAFLGGDSADTFASNCIAALLDPDLRTRLEISAYDYANTWNRKQREALCAMLKLSGLRDRFQTEEYTEAH